MTRYACTHSRWPERAAGRRRCPDRNAGLFACVAVAAFAIAACWTADPAGSQPSGLQRIERQIASDMIPARLIALRFWPEQQQAVRAPTLVEPTAVQPALASVDLSDRELTFKHGYALRQAALRQMLDPAPADEFLAAAAQAKLQDALRADPGRSWSRDTVDVHEHRDAPTLASRNSQSQITRAGERTRTVKVGTAEVQSNKPGQPVVVSFGNGQEMMSARMLSGLY